MVQIQNVIFYLDGAIFNLNALRFHYYALLCQNYGLPANKKEFYDYLESNHEKDEDILSLESRIEDYVKLYCKKHGTPLNLGVREYLHYLKTQNIRVIIYTPYDIKEAYEFLKEEDLSKYVHRIYSKDDELFIHSKDPIETIIEAEEITVSETLIVTGKEKEGSKHLDQGFNVVLVKDMVTNSTYRSRYTMYTIDLSNMISKMISHKHDPLDLFSPILGFNKKMNKEELDQRYILLKDYFKEDPKLMAITEDAYQNLCEALKNDIPVIQTHYSLETSLTLETDDLFDKKESILKINPSTHEENLVHLPEVSKEPEIYKPREEWVFDEDEDKGGFFSFIGTVFYYFINAVLFTIIALFSGIVFTLGIYPYLVNLYPQIQIVEQGFEVFHKMSYLWVQLIYQSFSKVMDLPDYRFMIEGNDWISSFGISLIVYAITIMFIYLIFKVIIDTLFIKDEVKDD